MAKETYRVFTRHLLPRGQRAIIVYDRSSAGGGWGRDGAVEHGVMTALDNCVVKDEYAIP